MKIIENLTKYQNAGRYFLGVKEMRENINFENWETKGIELVENRDFRMHDVSSRMNEIQNCPTCGNVNAKKWATEFCVLKNEPAVACEECTKGIVDPYEEIFGEKL